MHIILIILAIPLILLGLGAFLNPNIARWINAPGGPKLKAIIAMIAGFGMIIVGLII